MATKPSMDVYYKQGSAEFGKQMAAYQYEQGDKEATWVDPTYGLLKYADYLNPTQSVNAVAYKNMAENPTVFSPGSGGYATKQEIQSGTANPNSVGVNPTIQNGVVSSTPVGSTLPSTTPKTAAQIQFESLYPGKQYVPPVPTTAADKSSTKSATNTVKGYDTNNNWAEVWVPAGKYVPGVSATPKQITTNSVKGATNTDLSSTTGTPQNSADANSMMAGAETSMAELIKSLTPEETKEDKQKQDLFNKLISSAENTKQIIADQLTAEQSSGLPEMRAQFADINAQILAKLAEDRALEASYNQANTEVDGKSISIFRKQGQQAQNYKMYLAQKNNNAAAIGLLQATALGLQGKITDAQNTVNRAIDLKFKVQEANNAIYEAQLKAIQPILDKQQKTQALAQQIILDQKKQALADQKDEEKGIQGLMLKAMDVGITDMSVISAISSAKSPEEAIITLGQNLPKVKSGDLQFISGTKNQRAGVFDKNTGEFTPLNGVSKATGGGGGSGSGTTTTIKNATTKMTGLLGSVAGSDGFVSPEDYLTARNAWVKEGFTPTEFDTKFRGFKNPNNSAYNVSTTSQKKAEEKNEQFLNKDYFLKSYSKDQLKKSAKDAGFASVWNTSNTEIDKYLTSVEKSIQAYRDQGFTDKQILAKMQ